MKKTRVFSVTAAALLCFAGLVGQVSSQQGATTTSKRLGTRSNIIGEVRDAQGNPIKGAEITVQDLGGRVAARAVTNDKGHYVMECLELKQYQMILSALPPGFQGQTAVATLGEKGLIANWLASATAPAIVTAKQGGGTCGGFFWGLNETEALVIVVGTVGAGISLGLALDGAFDNSPRHPASPSQ